MFQLQTLTPMQDLILLLMASEVEGLNVFFLAPSNRPFKSAYCHHEKEKRHQYEVVHDSVRCMAAKILLANSSSYEPSLCSMHNEKAASWV